jgi:hypothetical protein
MNNWNRLLFNGLEITPEIREDQMLVLMEDGIKFQSELTFNWLRSIALDMNVKCRGLAVAAPFQSFEALIDAPGIRVLKSPVNRSTKDDI